MFTNYKDMHLEAKAFPEIFPYGSGSWNWKHTRLTLLEYTKNRILDLDSRFRRHYFFCFFEWDR